LVVVAGTGTEVGKTWATCQLARQLGERGLRVCARKLAQSFAEGDKGTDADLLAAATGETVAAVCPPFRWYPRPMAPPMAAESMGLPAFTMADLLAELCWPPAVDVGLVECAGGVGSPQAGDADCTGLVQQLSPDVVVLVARAGLGTLSDVRLAVRALPAPAVLVYLNRFDAGEELHFRNRQWLTERDGLEVFVSTGQLAEALLAA
jgi:dethiobiotin synthetase